MTISNGNVIKKLVLYPLAQPHANLEQTIWPTLDEEDQYSLKNIMNIECKPLLRNQDDDDLIAHIIQNNYGRDPLKVLCHMKIWACYLR